VKLLLGICALAGALSAQTPPPLSDAQLQTKPFQGDLGVELRSAAPTWFAYSVKTSKRGQSCCWDEANHGCYLEDSAPRKATVVSGGGPVHLEGSSDAAVLFRVANDYIEKVQLYSIDCPLDAGGLRFVWLTGVSAHASLTELSKLARQTGNDHVMDGAVFAIAQHDSPEADELLSQFVASNAPERLREKTTFWLGTSRGLAGVQTLKEVVRRDPSEGVR
jgi:hypothetical protein